MKKTICKVLATAVALQAALSFTPSFAAAEQQGVTQQSINSAKQTGEWEKWCITNKITRQSST
ncbi:hypothetical protein [Bacillus paramycoides]|uniref:hypothetical protein n=1 Tax=Bacillus paramycoides TaxID=2026194 RepID=UPI003CFBC7BD